MAVIEVVAFDCDGVLFNTDKANHSYYNNILAHFGRPEMTPEEFKFVHMHTVDEALAFLFKNQDQLRTAHMFRRNMSYAPFIRDMVIEPCLKPLLNKIRPEFGTAIATNRSDTMDRVMTEFDLTALFDIVVCAADVKNPKPHPEPLFKIIDHFGTTPEKMLYVGDSEVDEKAAIAAGVVFVAYQNKKLAADFHISSLREIESILAG